MKKVLETWLSNTNAFCLFSFFIDIFPRISVCVLFFIYKWYHLVFFSHSQNYRIGIKIVDRLIDTYIETKTD